VAVTVQNLPDAFKVAMSSDLKTSPQNNGPTNGYDCENAISIDVNGQSITWSNINVPETPMICDTALDAQGPSVWYYFVGTGKPISVTACDDTAQADSGIYISSSSPGTCSALSCDVKSSDVGNQCLINPDSSRATFDSVSGLLYYVQVFSHGVSPATTGQLRVVEV
jgi:hypothetical protein